MYNVTIIMLIIMYAFDSDDYCREAKSVSSKELTVSTESLCSHHLSYVINFYQAISWFA